MVLTALDPALLPDAQGGKRPCSGAGLGLCPWVQTRGSGLLWPLLGGGEGEGPQGYVWDRRLQGLGMWCLV